MALLNAHCTRYWYFKDPSIVFTDTLYFNFTVACPNKNNKKMEKFGYFTKCRNILKQLSTVPAIVWITKQHLKDILKGFLLKLKIIKVVFKIIFWAFLSNFWLIPIMNHYRGSWYSTLLPFDLPTQNSLNCYS